MAEQHVTDDVIRRIRRNLTDFGYSALTDAEVRHSVNEILAGNEPSDIIGMFARTMLEENGYLEDTTDARD